MTGDGRRVALTFDMEHPSRRDNDDHAPGRLLDVLRRRDARATFFVQGRWARSHPDVARRVLDEGHLVGSHSHFHAPMPLLTHDGVRADLHRAREALLEVVGCDPRPWFRCPFGAGHDDPAVLSVLADEGYRDIHWDVDGFDWQEGRTACDIEQSVVSGVEASPGDPIVLLHTWPRATPEATERIIDRLVSDGVELVTVDALVRPRVGNG
jgi:peptidoglycan-N-acetylglucosamine deacetylase